MGDLLVIVPTRQRLANARRLAEACEATCTAGTQVIFAADHDDRSYDGWQAPPRSRVTFGPRASCIGWTNAIAGWFGPGDYRAFASLGDDHVPETPGWDSRLLAAIDGMGGTGIAYGDDTLQHENLPTAPVISADIAAALGWLMHPGMIHFYCDNIWKDIAQGAGCLAYLPDVVIRHLHYSAGTAARDKVYCDEEHAMNPDGAAYRAWRASPDGMAADVAKVRALMAAR